MVAAAAAQASLVGPGLARADITEIADPVDSVGPLTADRPVDIVAVRSSHTRSGRFRYRIDTVDGFLRRDAPCLRVRAPRPVREVFVICGDGAVVEEGGDPTGATATVRRPRPTTIVYSFAPDAIGRPSSHRWRALVMNADCPEGICDAAPDRGDIVHRRIVSSERWAERFLDEIDARGCRDNRIVVLAWIANENTEAIWNPLATTRRMTDSWDFNSHGVQNYISFAQGLDATRETLENGYDIYGYGRIVRALERCARPLRTADAIRDSRWCFGCSNGEYVVGIVPSVQADYATYAAREISTA